MYIQGKIGISEDATNFENVYIFFNFSGLVGQLKLRGQYYRSVYTILLQLHTHSLHITLYTLDQSGT